MATVMGTRIEQRWKDLRVQGRKAFVPYVMCGDPDVETTLAALQALAEAGADFIEMGIPFSDPVGDGPVIQEAGQRSLRAGTKLRHVFEVAREYRRTNDTPLLLMTYFNPIFRHGVEAFAREAAEAGVDGFIVPDLPPEEADEFLEYVDQNNLALIYLLAPTTSPERMKEIASRGRGFLYYISRTGVTGMQDSLADDLQSNLALLRSQGLPVVVGFGVSNREQAAAIAPYADGVVIGSAIVKIMAEAGAEAPARIRDFVAPIIEALHGAAVETK